MLAHRQGATLGQYELLRVIGSGGMGVVYEAHQPALGRRVAIKLLHPIAPGSARADIAPTRFLREGRAAAQVRHDHVVNVFDLGTEDGTLFLVMELVEGESLAERIEREGPLALPVALELLLPIFSAVSALHAAGIIHRDLKPANILLGRGRSGEVAPKLVDFGVSRLEDDAPGLTESGVVVGSYPYMPPEQALGRREVSELADQYSLAALLYECVTGSRPFEGATAYDLTHAILHAPLVLPSKRRASLPKALDAVIARALRREAADRFACVEDFAAALLPFAAPEVATHWAAEFVADAAEEAAEERGRKGARPTSRIMMRAGVGIAALAGAALLAAAAFPRHAPARPEAIEAHRAEEIAPVQAAVGAPLETRVEAAPMVTSGAMTTASGPLVASAAPATTPSAPARAKPPARPKAVTRAVPAKADDAPLDNGAPLLEPE